VPVTLKLLFKYNRFTDAVAAFTLSSDSNNLPIEGL
jgi:hypothetical protein